jgi:four helix bundle protein
MRNYKKYEVWLKSHELVKTVYRDITPGFPKTEEYGLANQMRRAAYSIPINIAEGCGRKSEKDFAHFLDTSLGSTHELEYCLLLAQDLKYIESEQFEVLNEGVNQVKAMIINLIKSIRT